MSVVRIQVPSAWMGVLHLAGCLEQMERRGVGVDAGQYRALVRQLTEVLRPLAGQDELRRLLTHFPAAAELYENLHYAHAGLVCAPVEASAQSEQAAQALMRRLRGR